MSSDLGPQLTSRDYTITGNYGTFEIQKTVRVTGYTDWDDDEWEADVYEHTGIMMELEQAGWKISSQPDGEDWEIEHVTFRS